MNMQTAGSTNEESLQKSIGKYTAVKLNSGRVISGILREEDGGYSIKLGVKFIPLDISTVKRVTTTER